jgi:gluconokinase
MNSQLIVLMGVSGSGKTSVGRVLAQRLGVPFFEGDEFHPAENIAKIGRGQPLTDADRQPWLAALHALLAEHAHQRQSLVLACSALKAAYRQQLQAGGLDVTYVYLKGDYDLIAGRMRTRLGHFMPEALLQSQFDALEEPEGAIAVNVDQSVEQIVAEISRRLAGPPDPPVA